MRHFVRKFILPALVDFSNLSPGLGAHFAHYAWFRPVFARTANRFLPSIRDTQRIQFGMNRKLLSAQCAGTDGPLVFFVHGWGGQSIDFRKFVDLFVGNKFRVVLVDLPAHGMSYGRRTDIGQMADALLRFADELGQPHAVVAHSLGATCATLAISRGLATRQVLLIAPPATFGGMVEKVSHQFGYRPHVVTALRRMLENDFGEKVWDEFSTVYHASRMTIPAIIIHDNSDEHVPIAEGRDVATAWRESEFFATEGLGHKRLLASEIVISKAVASVLQSSAKCGVGK